MKRHKRVMTLLETMLHFTRSRTSTSAERDVGGAPNAVEEPRCSVPWRRIEVRCVTCGVVGATVLDCEVCRCVATDTYTMTFLCPVCGVRGSRCCDRATVVELVAGGALLTRSTVPDEIDDPVRRTPRTEAWTQMFAMLEDHTWLDHLVELR